MPTDRNDARRIVAVQHPGGVAERLEVHATVHVPRAEAGRSAKRHRHDARELK